MKIDKLYIIGNDDETSVRLDKITKLGLLECGYNHFHMKCVIEFVLGLWYSYW